MVRVDESTLQDFCLKARTNESECSDDDTLVTTYRMDAARIRNPRAEMNTPWF